jgi:PAS domain S-box-containing protein
MKSWYSIRIMAPVLATALALGAVAIEYVSLSTTLTASEQSHALTTLRHSAQLTQGAVDRELRRGELTGVQQILAELNFQPMVSDALVLDASDRVLAASNRTLRGLSAAQTGLVPASALAQVRQTGSGDVESAGNAGRAIGIYPISLPVTNADRLRSAPGLLVITFDFTERLQAVQSEILRVTLQSAAVIAGTILLISLGMHFVITRRVARIVRATDRYLAGASGIRSRVGGNDEIGTIGQAFDRVADAAEAAKAELLEANKELEARVTQRTAELQSEVEERRAAEHELAASQDQLRAILDTAADAVIAIDGTGHVLEFNPAAERLFGWSAQEMRGAPVVRLMPQDVGAVHGEHVSRFHATGEAKIMGQEREVLAKRRDGSLFPLELTVSASDVGGQRLYIGVGRDITARRESEAAVAAAQRSLLQAEKMAALGSLIAGVAHEVNTPMGVGVTAASHLHESIRAFDARYREGSMRRNDLEEFLAVAEQSASILETNLSRASELIRSFKQVAVDQTDGEVRELGLAEYTEKILTSLRPLFKNRQVEVDLAIPPQVQVTLQAGALAQIITNLVKNSLVHAFDPQDRGQIRLSARQVDGLIHLTYSDDGKGMTPDVARRVFDPFFTTRRGAGGSGLGMHIVFNLVTQGLHGEIRCESTPGQGTQFHLKFPGHTPAPASIPRSEVPIP